MICPQVGKEAPEVYATRRARETGKLYGVWTGPNGEAWSAIWCRMNANAYAKGGAVRLDLYDKDGWRTGREVRP